jgi:hypothetical protein
VELVMVIAILGIVPAMAVPRLEGWVRVTHVDGMVGEFMSNVSHTCVTAARSGQRIQLRVDAASRRYKIYQASADGSWRRIKVVPWTEAIGPAFGPTATMEFDSRGLLVTGGAGFTAVMGGRSRSLQVLPTKRAYLH